MAINKDEIFLNRSEIKKEAARLHEMGYNCAQSVVCAMAPAIDLDADGAFVLAEGFGAGMGGMTETCGAVSGAVMALSQVESTGRDQIGSKAKTYKLSREMSARFASTNGSTVCAAARAASMTRSTSPLIFWSSRARTRPARDSAHLPRAL